MRAQPREPTVEAAERPRTIGRYRVLDELASGGMATVYLGAADGPAGFEKLVAIKRIHPHLARDPRNREMFLDEARVAARIVHPNVCGVIDFGEAHGEYYLAMDHLVGVPLGRLMRVVAATPALATSPDWLSVLVRIISDAAEGLHAAHELRDGNGAPLSVVHRDVSPSNLFIGFDGATRVVDFGVAAFAGRLHHTVTGEVKGKLAYMAPEQVRQSKPDRRMDVWALGVVTWELVSLRRLFRRDGTAATLYGVLEDDIDAPSVSRPAAHGLDAPIMAALDRDPEKRTPTARRFAEELVNALDLSGRRVATPAEVASFIERAMPDEERTKRERLVLARERFESEQLEIATSTGALRAARSRRWGLAAGLAVLGALAVLGLYATSGGEPPPPSRPDRTIAITAPPAEPPAPDRVLVDTTERTATATETDPPAAVVESPRAGGRRRPPPRGGTGGRSDRDPPSGASRGSVDLTTEW